MEFWYEVKAGTGKGINDAGVPVTMETVDAIIYESSQNTETIYGI